MLNCRTAVSKTAKHKENNGEEESLCRKNTKGWDKFIGISHHFFKLLISCEIGGLLSYLWNEDYINTNKLCREVLYYLGNC